VKSVGGLGKSSSSSSSSSSDTAVVLELLTQLKYNIENGTNIHYDEGIKEIIKKIDSMANTTRPDSRDTYKHYTDFSKFGTLSMKTQSQCEDIRAAIRTEMANKLKSIVIPPVLAESQKQKYLLLRDYSTFIIALIANLKNLIEARAYYKCIANLGDYNIGRFINVTARGVFHGDETQQLIAHYIYLNKTVILIQKSMGNNKASAEEKAMMNITPPNRLASPLDVIPPASLNLEPDVISRKSSIAPPRIRGPTDSYGM